MARVPRRLVNCALLASVLLAAATCAAEGKLLYVLPVGGLVLAIVARQAARRAVAIKQDVAGAEVPAPRRSRRFAPRLASVLTVTHVVLLACTLNIAREYYLTNRFVAGELQSLARGLRLYHDSHGVYPETVADLVLDGTCSTKQISSPYDPGTRWPGPPDWEIHTSFTLRPGVGPWRPDPALVVLHDREPFSRAHERLFRSRGRLVLFGDERVGVLTPVEFEQALRTDLARRLELGWPTEFAVPATRRLRPSP